MLLKWLILALLGVLVPLSIWLVTKGQHHLNRALAWSFAIPMALLVVQQLSWLVDESSGASQVELLAHALILAGVGTISGLMVGWLVRTRHDRDRSPRST